MNKNIWIRRSKTYCQKNPFEFWSLCNDKIALVWLFQIDDLPAHLSKEWYETWPALEWFKTSWMTQLIQAISKVPGANQCKATIILLFIDIFKGGLISEGIVISVKSSIRLPKLLFTWSPTWSFEFSALWKNNCVQIGYLPSKVWWILSLKKIKSYIPFKI